MSTATPDPLSPQPSTTDARRRQILGLTAAGAAALGVGAAWWRARTPDAPPPMPPAEGFWTSQFDLPQGGTVSMEAFRGHPLLVNFWATWCAPCVEELPLINDFYRENKVNGWQVIGLAVDKPGPVQSFLKKMPLDFPIGMAGLAGAELSRAMGNVAGGLPFSLVLGRDGMVLQRKMGRLSEADLSNWLRLK